MATKRKCSKCNRSGHNARTCMKKGRAVRKKKSAKKSPSRKKKTTKRKCSKCNKTGHNARTCKKKKAAVRKVGKKKTTKKTKKAKTKRKSTTTGGKGRSLLGSGKGWLVLHYGGTTAKGNISDKAWAVKVSGTTVTTRHGKSYGQKKETPRKFKTKQAALTFAAKKIGEKLNKGYHVIGGNKRKRRKTRRRRKNSRRR